MSSYYSDMLAYQQTYATTANTTAIPIFLNSPQPATPAKEGPLEWLRRQVDEMTDLAVA
jgi:hypothetical protein